MKLTQVFYAKVAAAIGKLSLARPWLPAGVLIGMITYIAFGLRVHAVAWGLPYVDHPDEPAAANNALNMIRRGDWDPRSFMKPSLYYYLLRLDFAAYLRYAFARGLYQSIDQLPQTTDRFLATPDLFIWGRMLSVILGTATVVALYFIVRHWWGRRVALIAAALLAVSSFHMRQSQYITVDVTTALFALLALAAAMRLLRSSTWRAYALAGVAAGLAASAKYNAGGVVVSIAVAHLFRWQRSSARQSGRLAWAALWGLLGFLIATPYAALSFDTFAGNILRQFGIYSSPGQASGRWPVGEYVRFFWTAGLLPLPCLATIAGIAWAFLRRDKPALVMLAFVATQLLFFLAQTLHFDRNLLPIVPPLLVCAAIAIDATAGAVARLGAGWARSSASDRHAQRRAHDLAMVVLSALVVYGPALGALAFTRFEALPHSKVRAGDFVRAALPHGAPIAVALDPVPWSDQPFITPFGDVSQHDAAWYRAQGYRYLVANTKRINQARYRALRDEAHVLEVFPGDADGQPGPRMEALDLGDHPEALAIERRDATFGDKLALLGFQRGAGSLRGVFSPLAGGQDASPGQALQINVYWRALRRMDEDYVMFLHLVNVHNQIVAQRDTAIRAADYPTSRWQPGELVVDIADLPLPKNLAAGEYGLQAGVYAKDSLARLPLADHLGGALTLVTLTIK